MLWWAAAHRLRIQRPRMKLPIPIKPNKVQQQCWAHGVYLILGKIFCHPHATACLLLSHLGTEVGLPTSPTKTYSKRVPTVFPVQRSNRISLTKLAESMIPSSTGWVQSRVNFKTCFFFLPPFATSFF